MNLIETYTRPLDNNVSFDRNNKQKQIQQNYQDPLRKWPLKGLAYSNELGAVISPISPKLGAALWVPALMYFGADIYDKYKNDNTYYDPSSKRGLKEAIFQALASVVLPTLAVHSGQKAISIANRLTKTGLTTQTKEDAIEFALDFMEKSSLHKNLDKIDDYKSNLKASLDNVLIDNLGEYHSKTTLQKVLGHIFSHKKYEELSLANKEKLSQFMDKKVDTMFKMREELMQNKKPRELSNRLFRKFIGLQDSYLKEFGDQKYMGKAAKSIIKDFEKSEIFKTKMIKTLGGFIALGLLIKPIDHFVEHIVIKKTIEPHLDKIIPDKSS